MYLRKFMPAIAGVAVMALVAACGGSSGGQAGGAPQAGGTLVVGTEFTWRSLDPATGYSDTEREIEGAIFDRLLTTNQAGEVQPGLAESYEMSPDAKTYTLHLRQGVTFHDGTPFNAQAVKINLERIKKPETGCLCVARFERVSSIETPDDHTVLIRMSKPNVAFLYSVLTDIFSSQISPAALEKYGREVSRHPVGTGPFQYESEIAGNTVVLTKWDKYWQPGRPYLDRLTFKATPDPQTRYASLQSGAIQVADNLQPREVAQLQRESRFTLHKLGGYGYNFVQFNVTRAPFNDIRARQAVCSATDRDAINQAVNFGLYDTKVDSPQSPSHPYYPGDLANAVRYDQEKSKGLSTQVGGVSFALTVGQSSLPAAQALQGQWASIPGLGATINTVDPTLNVKLALDHDYQAMLFRVPGNLDPDTTYSGTFRSTGGSNFTGLKDPVLDGLIDQGRETPNGPDRKEVYRKAGEQLASDVVTCPLWGNGYFRGMAKKVQGIPEIPDGRAIFTDAYLAG